MHMTIEESLVASTINAAAAIDRQATAGSLEAGKPLDAVVVNGPLSELVRVGAPVIQSVIKRGRIVA
jgi:imidazolonepropionase